MKPGELLGFRFWTLSDGRACARVVSTRSWHRCCSEVRDPVWARVTTGIIASIRCRVYLLTDARFRGPQFF